MDSPETYNRVKHLGKNTLRSLLSILSSLLLLSAIGGVTFSYITGHISTPADISLYIAETIVAATIWFFAKKLPSYCRHCKGDLAHINRPMILSSDYLAMQGSKQGEYYYAPCPWGQKHSPTGWAKISHRAPACHHCRISQEGYQPHYETVSQEELAEIQGNS